MKIMEKLKLKPELKVDGTIVSLTVGSCYLTLWMDENGKYANSACVHNANDDENGKIIQNDYPDNPDEIIWLSRKTGEARPTR